MNKDDNTLLNEIQKRIQFETLIADISARFVRVPSDKVDSEIEKALKQISEFFDVDRCGILSFSDDMQSLYLTHGYYSKGLSQRVPKDINLAEIFPYACQLLLKGKPSIVCRVSDFPPEAKQDQLTRMAMGVKSSITLPVFSTKGIRYLLTLDTMYKEYDWPEEYIPRLTLLGEILVNALERREKDLALGESEARLSLAADSANAGLWTLDLITNIFWLTPKTRELFGFPPDIEINFEQFFNVVHPDDRELIDQIMQKLLQSNEVITIDYRIVHPDKNIRWVTSRGRSFIDTPNRQNCIMGVTVDITEQKLLYNRVAQAAAEWGNTFNAVQDMILILDDKLSVLRVNRVVESFFQRPQHQIVGRICSDLICGKDEPMENCPVEKALQSKQHEESDIYLKQKNIWLQFSADPVFDNQGDIVGFVVILKDITRRKQDEKKILENRKTLRVFTGQLLTIQEEERRRLARELHDDFTQRLAVLAIDASRLESTVMPENAQWGSKLQQIKDNIITLSTDIHDISRQLHPSIIDDLGLGRAIQSECNNFTQRMGIRIDLQTDNIPRKIDRDISMVLFRITQEGLRNIYKHARVEEAEVSLACKDNHIILTIHDSGAGFDTTHSQHTAGLGLLSMKERVQLVQGTLSIDSVPGCGTQIRVVIPLKQV